MKNKIKIKSVVLFFFLVFMYLNTVGQDTLTGRISYFFDPNVANPLSHVGEEAVFSFITFSGTYFLTLDSLQIPADSGYFIVKDIQYFGDDIVTITGKTSLKQGEFFLKEYYELEIETIEKSSLNQNIHPFLGTYTIEGKCTNNDASYIYSPKEVVIMGERGFSMPLYIEYRPMLPTEFDVFVSEDSLSIPMQWESDKGSFSGKGKINGDSIFLNTIYSNYGDDFSKTYIETCNCKGKRKEVGISPIEPAPNKVYYNAATISPNPNNGTFTINTSIDPQEVISVQVFSMLGQSIYKQEGLPNKIIQLPPSTSGVFYVEIITTTQKFIRKMVVQ